MMLRVGPYLYRVKHIAGYIQHEGERCLGLCDNDRHELLVSDVPSEAQQVQVICHEYAEAWLYHFGGKLTEHADKELMCDLFGMAMAQLAMDLMRTLRGELAETEAAAPEAPQEVAMHMDERLEQLEAGEAPWRVRIYEPAC